MYENVVGIATANSYHATLEIVSTMKTIDDNSRYRVIGAMMDRNRMAGRVELNSVLVEALIENGLLGTVVAVGALVPKKYLSTQDFLGVLKKRDSEDGVRAVRERFSKEERFFWELLDYNPNAVQMLEDFIRGTYGPTVLSKPFDELARNGNQEAIVVLRKYTESRSRLRFCTGPKCIVGEYVKQLLAGLENPKNSR
jgi:hypothetical protein